MSSCDVQQTYVGICDACYGGIRSVGSVVKDAWLSDINPQTETCKYWSREDFRELHKKVVTAWQLRAKP